MVRVLLYGNSIFLAGLAAQLAIQANLQFTTCVQMNTVELRDFDVIFVDLKEIHAADVLALLQLRSKLHIIGINTDLSTITVISGQVYPAHTLEEIFGCLEVIAILQADEKPSLLGVLAGSPTDLAVDSWEY